MSKTWANLSQTSRYFLKFVQLPRFFEQYFKSICTKIESFAELSGKTSAK